MDVVSNQKDNNDEGGIQTILEMLKKQIDRYDTTKENPKSKAELTRVQRIQKLMMEEKHLTTQFEQIKKELKRYERKYEKGLKKKVKFMKMQIAENKQKLEVTKQKYFELNMQLAPFKLKRAKKTKTILKVKTMPPKFKQKNIPHSKKIRIKIKNNVKLDKREMHFVKDVNEQNAFKNLKVTPLVEPMAVNIRECKIIVQRLTEEQMNKYVDQKRLDQSQIRNRRITRESSQKINGNEINTILPNWQIKIPKSVFEESQKENKNYDLNMASTSKDVI
ncbi:hypothetical protein E2986_03190 [Frieseomelitta varia]|uniref:Uncharacterized protein n=1 Tax=Frieseomelitta varia TaxID=561572 RepID=A0A833W1P0_9HYME|nr:uncharacterized protein LOC122538476 [Frieseomelitta varia]KAF3429374.1 hypothetical protein E2986_03190 [Frieseomelitta varia]